MKYNLPPFNEKEKHGFFEQSILDFSIELFRNPVLGLSLGIILNILYIYSYFKSKSCLSIIFYIFIVYLLFSIILSKLANLRSNYKEKKEEPLSEEKLNAINKELNSSILYFRNFIKKTISLEDKLYTVRVLIELYLLMKITSFLTDKFILFFILNIIIFYAPIEKHCPHFVFKCRMTIKQIIEGIIVLLTCLIPKYEEPIKDKKIE